MGKFYNKKNLFLKGGFIILTLFAVFSITTIYSKNYSFGADGKSPLKKDNVVSKAYEVQKSFQEIFKINKDRVVYISTEQEVKMASHPFFNDPFFKRHFNVPKNSRSKKRKITGLGTGFVLSEDGYICTNQHVVKGVDKVKVKLNGKEYEAKVIGSDEETDLALLKIHASENFKPVYLGNSDKVKVGDWAIAIGNPFGLDRTFTVGIISATGRNNLNSADRGQSHLQTDASINPGNSGGPLINIYGEVVGINRMIYSKSGGNMGIGFAIPINRAINILEQLKKHKKIRRGHLGVQIVPFSEEYAKELGLKNNQGALIGGVMQNSPAEKAGVMVSDVILNVNGKIIKNYSDLVTEVRKTSIGKVLKVVVWRKKTKISLFITVRAK